MIPVIVHLRTMQLYAHHAHNLCARSVFFSDHEFFGETYAQLETDYDSVIEREIGLAGEEGLELSSIVAAVAAKLTGLQTTGIKENKVFFMKLLEMEKQLRILIQQEIKAGVTEGTRQLLGDICNLSEMRQYKIQQRLK